MFIQYMCQQNEEQLAAKIDIRDKNIMIEIITIVIVSIQNQKWWKKILDQRFFKMKKFTNM